MNIPWLGGEVGGGSVNSVVVLTYKEGRTHSPLAFPPSIVGRRWNMHQRTLCGYAANPDKEESREVVMYCTNVYTQKYVTLFTRNEVWHFNI